MLNVTLDSLGLETVRGDESFVSRVQDMPVSKEEFFDLTKMAKYVGVTEQFKDVINTFHTPEGETPAGFKRELVMEKDGVVKVDLVRDISYDKNGILRPTNVLFSADSANPYENVAKTLILPLESHGTNMPNGMNASTFPIILRNAIQPSESKCPR